MTEKEISFKYNKILRNVTVHGSQCVVLFPMPTVHSVNSITQGRFFNTEVSIINSFLMHPLINYKYLLLSNNSFP